MPVTFHLAKALHRFTEGQSRVTIDASPKTVADALSLLWTHYPGMRDHVLTKAGEVLPDVNILVWNESIRFRGGMTTPLPEESDVFIVSPQASEAARPRSV
ncbi:MAG: hypothetical protein AB1451_02570 [Nitrospirota bacterium]